MGLWAIVLLVIDMVLMGSIFYILVFRKPLVPGIVNSVTDAAVSKELILELAAVKKLASNLDAKSVELREYEKRLKEKQRSLDEMLRSAQETVSLIESSGGDAKQDVYSKAVRMLRTGTTAEETARSLGLLNGEAELLSALNRM